MTEATPERRRSLLKPTVVMAQLGGLALFGTGLAGLFMNVPGVLAILMILTGAAVMRLGIDALHKRRVAWAFLCSIYGTLSVALFFGGPQIEEWLARGVLIAYLPALLCVVVTVFLVLTRDEF